MTSLSQCCPSFHNSKPTRRHRPFQSSLSSTWTSSSSSLKTRSTRIKVAYISLFLIASLVIQSHVVEAVQSNSSEETVQSNSSEVIVIETKTNTAPSAIARQYASDVPSMVPTPRNTGSLTLEPTASPPRSTPQPTSQATSQPTPQTSDEPTQTQITTDSPTTFQPTSPKTVQPTRDATTFVPSDAPSLYPTAAPVSPPPTQYPTRRPNTRKPTIPPTSLPPTNRPTTSPAPTTVTPKPTISPAPTTETPTYKPTLQSDAPTSTQSLTRAPARPPSSSIAPSTAPTYQIVKDQVSLVMTLEMVTSTFQNRSAYVFELETATHIKGSILTQDFGNTPLTYIVVDTNIVTQKLSGSASAASSGQHPQPRNLQEQLYPLEVSLDVFVDYRSANTEFTAKQWVSDAFNTQLKRDSYVSRLVGTKDPAFVNIKSVQVLVDGSKPIEQPDKPTANQPSSSDNNTVAIIVGSVVGGLVLVAVAIFVILRVKKPVKKNANYDSNPATATTESDQKLATEILVDRQDDISTLGDPVVYGGMMIHDGEERDERTASVMDSYDYRNQFLAAHGHGVGGTTQGENTQRLSGEITGVSSDSLQAGERGGPVGASVFSDDSSFEQHYAVEEKGSNSVEERFEVQVPPGKLGMVIDTPNGGVPIVHALKSESILAGSVAVGDRLLSVDNDDVTHMSALQVSKLISIKSDQARVLVFSRSSRSRLDSGDQIP